jgi:hypothetical protein
MALIEKDSMIPDGHTIKLHSNTGCIPAVREKAMTIT